jgi:hypothetical protein
MNPIHRINHAPCLVGTGAVDRGNQTERARHPGGNRAPPGHALPREAPS